MKYAEVRKAFTDYFAQHQHRVIESSRLIPHNDPTLMFTNAGMNQFKDVFLGTDQRDYKRAVTIQKCLRAGGKHNDLENVGFTARHHTFFEMLGNFSFGDYFKREAIQLAWSFLTEILKIPKERLYVTVFTTDDEAFSIWENEIGVPKEKIFRYGEKDNFWRMGQTGPCGPCSEIFYDHNPSGPKIPLHEDEARFVEIWNLVFMQFFEDENGKQTPLPKPSVDTGAGLERMAAALQGFTDNYQCDIFQPLLAKACTLAGLSANWNALKNNPAQLGAVKVVADHSRAASFLIAEGVLPSNEGRGYVLRRIMRRAIRYARQLNSEVSIYPAVCETLIQTMGPYYPELTEKHDFILQAVRDEEKRFLQTLDKGSEILNQKIRLLKEQNKNIVDGDTAFTLYDTFGFPLDLTELIAKEHKMGINEEQFNQRMEKAKNQARSAQKSHIFSSNDKHLGEWTQNLRAQKGITDFVGYEIQNQLSTPVQSTLLSLSDGQCDVQSLHKEGLGIFAKTPFYAEGGGQIGDQGFLLDENDQVVATISDCKKWNDIFVHTLTDLRTAIQTQKNYRLQVDAQVRRLTACHHSATHLLHAALKKVLGSQVQQAGSLVTSEKLRFDFNHNQPVHRAELLKIENIVNKQIALALPVTTQIMGQKEAVAQGAVAMFGEKYGDQVRVIRMGTEDVTFSMELCGGTHVKNLSQIRLFKVISESGVSAGIRRIEAVVSDRAHALLDQSYQELMDLRETLAVSKLDGETLIQAQLQTQNWIEQNGNAQWDRLREAVLGRVALQTIDGLNDSHWLGIFEKLSEAPRKALDLISRNQTLQKEVQNLKTQSISLDDLLKETQSVKHKGNTISALIRRLDVTDRAVLSETADRLRDKQNSLVVALIGESENNQPKPLIVAVSKNLKGLHAGQIVKELCDVMGGKGGGRPDFAQGSVANLDRLNQATEKFYASLNQ